MINPRPGLRWGIEQRLEFIEFRLFWEGAINRADLIDFFGVSVPQASKDLSHYQELAPENMAYDTSLKRYVVAEHFEPKFLKPDANRYLSQLASLGRGLINADEAWFANAPSFDVIVRPKRIIDTGILRTLLQVVREQKSVDILYQSLNPEKPKPEWRKVTPHAFCFDGLRWHVRSYCHARKAFRDFLLPRIAELGEQGEPGLLGDADQPWHEIYYLKLKPHPRLSPEQQQAIAADYGMQDGVFELPMRLAMLFYFKKHTGLDYNETEKDPQQQHIVMADPESVREAERRANLPPVH